MTCGAALRGPFCHACGERVLTPADFRPGAFLASSAGAILDLDSRLWQTFRTLFRHPGRLTAEHMCGRRRPWLSPVQIFLIANLLFFLSLGTIGGVDAFTTPLRVHETQPFYGSVAARLASGAGAAGSAARADYERRFDEASPRFANSLVILLVPLYAAGMALLFRGRHGLVRHAVFAMHFVAAVLVIMALLPAILLPPMLLSGSLRVFLTRSEMPVTLLVLAILWTYHTFAVRTAYGTGRGGAVARGLAGVLLLAPVIIVYRALLFFTVHFAVV